MQWSLNLGRVFKIPVRVHWSMAILLFAYSWGAGLIGLATATVSLVLLFGSVLAHEVAHALTARRFGIGTSEILLLPIGGMAKIEREPANGRQEVAIALAGPAMSLALAGVAFALRAVIGPGSLMYSVATTLFAANLMLGLFNLLPAFPMDGGRVLRGALRARKGLLGATRIAARIGRIVAVPMVIAGFALGSFSLVLVAAFVWLAGRSEERVAAMHAEQEVFAPWRVTQSAPSSARGGWPGRSPRSLFDEARGSRAQGPSAGGPRRFVIQAGPFGYIVREVH